MTDSKFHFKGMVKDIRLITVILFFLFISPGLILPRGPEVTILGTSFYFFLNFLVCLIYIGLEILEYSRWSYDYETPFVPRTLILIRLVILLSPSVYMIMRGSLPENLLRFQINHVFMLLCLLPFYAYYAFPRRFALGFLLITLGSSLLYDILVKNLDHQNVFEMGFTLYRALTYVFFYLLAWLLDKQQISARENKKLLNELKESESRLREYAERIGGTVALEERTRLARDIHDSLGHSLTVVKIQQNKALAFLKVNAEESEQALLAAKASAEDAMSDIRTSLKRLNGEDGNLSLIESIPEFTGRLEDNGLEVEYRYTGDERGYNYSVIMGLYRLIQEGTTNILKHANAGKVTIKADFGIENALLELIDDGRGFLPDDIYQSGGDNERYGLKGLARRLELVNGELRIESDPGKGTKLTARVPRNPLAVNED